MARTLIMSAERIARTVSRLAYEVLERNQGAERLEICGIPRRGLVLAEALASQIDRIEQRNLQVHPVDVAPYRDDRERDEAARRASAISRDLTDRDVILVDDVLFTGRTARAALDAVVRAGRPRSIQLVALIDRGHREYPIQPDFVGRVIQTKHKERVVVEVDDAFAVYVEE